MARKIFIVYLLYTVIVFLSNTYIFKEDYADAIFKAVISGVIFTAIYAYIVLKNEKNAKEKAAEIKPVNKKVKRRP